MILNTTFILDSQAKKIIENAANTLVDEEMELARKRIDERRKVICENAATEFARVAKMEIVGQQLIFNISPKI